MTNLTKPRWRQLLDADAALLQLRRQFLSIQELLAERRGCDDEQTDRLRQLAAQALSACSQAGVSPGLEVDLRLLRPPWSSRRAAAASSANGSGLGSVRENRDALLARRPHASSLLKWLDVRSVAFEAYRRLEMRHMPWAAASVEATVSAVEQVRARAPHRPPRVLIAQGSLGAEAAAAAAAGARVLVVESNRFAARAITAVAVQHGVGHGVQVLACSLEELIAGGGEDAVCDVLVLTSLLEEAGLGRRLLCAAAAVHAAHAAAAAAASHAVGAQLPPLMVPHRVEMHAALALLTAGTVHGVDLSTL